MKPTIIVTGASRGLGEAISKSLAGLGARVVLNARSILDLERVAREIHDLGGNALAAPGDVGKEADCRQIVETTILKFGRIDALVNNAAIVEPIASIAEANSEAWERSWAVNVLGPVLLTGLALPYLRESHGRVINVSSGAAEHAIAGAGGYCASKAALNHFNRVLAVEEKEITAIAVRPGVVDTPMQTAIRTKGGAGMPAEVYDRFVRFYEEGELLSPEIPGRTLAILALYAPADWSGEFLSWDEERVQEMVLRFS
jgi:NAD(P)-dependent dehydrogenase (short-subunit alcohol dehydrogenase family)